MSPETKMLSQVIGLSKGERKEVEGWEEIKGKGFRFCCFFVVLRFSKLTSVRQNILIF